MRSETLASDVYVASLKPFFRRSPHLLLRLAYVATVGFFIWICAQFYIPGKGFTYLVTFSSKMSSRYIPPLRDGTIDHYEEPDDSPGYDAQYYAQIAMRPWLSNPALNRAVDSLPYRARRILFAWTAYGLALGDPARALHIYAVQNIACWLALAVLMLRWFPPVSWGNFARWFGVLFSFGLCFSVRGSLVDGPSLLLIAAGVALAEAGWLWCSALLLGVAGLGKETNVLAVTTLPLPSRAGGFRSLVLAVARALIVLLPLVLWMECMWFWLGSSGDAGVRNFARPLFGYMAKWAETLEQLRIEGIGSLAQGSMLMLVALTVQALFFALRPRWRDPWWRLGATYTVLMLALGDAVWEGYPGAASRVLLPMTLAFNIAVPRRRAWWLVLLLGNLTIFFSLDILRPPGNESFRVHGPPELRLVASAGPGVEARFSEHEWYLPERSPSWGFDYWRWSRGDAAVTFHNPQAFALLADISFGLKSNDKRQVVVREKGRELWRGETVRDLRDVTLRDVRLEPGDTVWRFTSDHPAEYPPNGDPRQMAFSLRNLEINIKSRAVPPPAAK